VDPLWRAVFGNDRPVEIEVGPGRGDVLVAFALERPAVNFFAIEHIHGAVERLRARLDEVGITNARVIAADAAWVLRHVVPRASVVRYHIYFPDPWPKRRHHKRRIVTPSLAEALRRTLVPGGVVHAASDLPWLFDEISRTLTNGGFTRAPNVWQPERPTTHFERKYARAGTFAGTFAPAEPGAAAQLPAPSPSPQKNS